ncbi:MAG: dockerin type I repeat-containing protein [Clostridiales bacterium]|nr:dockerin type I repeat-containing protein [Clostridiales bacterium]
MKVSKKIISIALALMLVFMCCVSAFAVENGKQTVGSMPPGTCAKDINISSTDEFGGYLEFNNTGYRLSDKIVVTGAIFDTPFTAVNGDYYISLHCGSAPYIGNFRIIIAEGTTRDVNIVFRDVQALKRDVTDFIVNKSECNVNIYFSGENIIKLDRYLQEGTNEFPWMNGIHNLKDNGNVRLYSLSNSLNDSFMILYLFGCGLMGGDFEFNGGTVTLVQDRSNNYFLYEDEKDYWQTTGITTTRGSVTMNDGKLICAHAEAKDVYVNGGELVIDNDMLPAYKIDNTVVNTEEYKNKTRQAKITALKVYNGGSINIAGGTLSVTGGDYEKEKDGVTNEYRGWGIASNSKDDPNHIKDTNRFSLSVTGGKLNVKSSMASAIRDVSTFEIGEEAEVSIEHSGANMENTVTCDDFKMTAGTFAINAPSETETVALKASNSYTLTGGEMSIEAYNCIDLGSLETEINDAKIKLNAKNSGIVGENLNLSVRDGKLDITAEKGACVSAKEIHVFRIYDGIVSLKGAYGVAATDIMNDGDIRIYGGNVHVAKGESEVENGDYAHFVQAVPTTSAVARNAFNETEKVYQCVITGLTPNEPVGHITYGGKEYFAGKQIKADENGLLALWLPVSDNTDINLGGNNTTYTCSRFEETLDGQNNYRSSGQPDSDTSDNTEVDTNTEERISDGDTQFITLITNGATITVDGVDYNDMYSFQAIKGENVVLPTPVLAGSTFKEWNTARDGSGIGMTGVLASLPQKNVTLYAIFENSGGQPLYGDVDCSGEVKMEDVTSLQKIIAALSTYESYGAMSKINADCDGDGQGSMTDVTLIQRYLAKLIPSLGPTIG